MKKLIRFEWAGMFTPESRTEYSLVINIRVTRSRWLSIWVPMPEPRIARENQKRTEETRAQFDEIVKRANDVD